MFNSEATVENWKHFMEYGFKTHILPWNFSFNHKKVKNIICFQNNYDLDYT